MATPRAAEHRDLEQRFRDIENQLRALSARLLGQRKLEVSEGDFVVSGGGGVKVQDGGTIQAKWENGNPAAYFGKALAPFDEGLIICRESDGEPVVYFAQMLDGKIGALIEATGQCWIEGVPLTMQSTGTTWVEGRPLMLTAPSGSVTVDGAGGVIVQCHGNQLQLGLDASNTFIGHVTTSSAANARLESTGQLLRVTSSRRYKANIEAAAIDTEAVLSVQGRTWQDKAELEAEGETARRHIGYIAEELHDAGLGEFVEYDDQGRPDAVQYDRMSVALLAVVRQQSEQIAALTARVDTLES